jgi:hypothetical protein
MNDSDISPSIELPFLAGTNPMGEPVFEALQAEPVEDEPGLFRLTRSPLLARNLAKGDKLKVINAATAEYELVKRSGNLCVRVFRKEGLSQLADNLTPRLEKLGGSLDLQNERALVYSLHVSIGFRLIEETLDECLREADDAVWYYGNVYDPEDGRTPMEWWQEFDSRG